jgi:hypothetical protein
MKSRLARLSEATRRSARPNPALASTPDGRPKPGPLLDREIDVAIGLLADMPFEELQERGWSLQPNNWCWPLNDVPFLRRHPELWAHGHVPRGVDWDLEGQVDLIRRLSGYSGELADVPTEPTGRPGEFAWKNGSFPPGDAYAYYGLVRDLKPRRVVEIGAGASTLVLKRALEQNGDSAQVTLIEPNPRWRVLGELPTGWQLQQTILQKADLTAFDKLTSGDVVFYDGSHCAETGGDVNWMLFRVLPRLSRGVWIQFHDIFWPRDYPPQWILHEGLSWNEQYILQAFLMHNSAYRVRIGLTMLTIERADVMSALFPGPSHGVSVWLEKDPGWPRRRAAERTA